MAGEELRVGIRLTADGRDFVGAVREAARELDKLSRAAKSASSVANSNAAANKKVVDVLRVARDTVIAYATNQALAALQTTKLSGASAVAVRQTTVLVTAMRGGSVAVTAYSRTVSVATVATRGFGRALKTSLGPIGLAFIGLELLLGKLLPAAEGVDDLTGSLDDSAESVEDLTEQFRYLSEAEVGASRGDLVEQIEAQTERLRQAQENVRELAKGELVPQRTLLGEGVVRVTDHAAVDEARASASGIAAELTALEARLADFDQAAAAAKVQRDRDEAEQRASELAAAAKQRQADINREAAQVVASLRGELEVLTDTYNAERSAIAQSTKLTEDQKEAALALLETRHQQALTDLELAEAEKAAAAAAATGVSALADLREETAALTAGEYESIEALESERRKRELALEVRERFTSATPDTVAAIVDETLKLEELKEKLQDETAARERSQELREAGLKSLTGGPNPYAAEIEGLQALLAAAPEQFGTGLAGGLAAGVIEQKIAYLEDRGEEDKTLEALRTQHEAELLETKGYQDRVEQAEDEHQQRLLDIKYRHFSQAREVAKRGEEFEKASTKARTSIALGALAEGFGQLGQHSRKAFRLSQAAALAEAIVNGHAAIVAALDAPPGPPFSYVFAAAAAATVASNIASIKAQKPPQAYAYGGIVDSPTFFSHRGGFGLAGEAGPEAILPLRRLSSGRLGVEAVGGRGDLIFSPSIHVTVEPSAGSDAYGFGSEVGLRIRRELEPLIRDVMVNERRPGGVLNPTDRVHAY